MNKFDLEERLINFAVLIVEIEGTIPNTRAANHLAGQLLRSGTFTCFKLWRSAKWRIMNENNELISIFLKSAETAQKNDERELNLKSKIVNPCLAVATLYTYLLQALPLP